MLMPTVVTKPKTNTMFNNNQGRSLVRTGKGPGPRPKPVSVVFWRYRVLNFFISSRPSYLMFFRKYFCFDPPNFFSSSATDNNKTKQCLTPYTNVKFSDTANQNVLKMPQYP